MDFLQSIKAAAQQERQVEVWIDGVVPFKIASFIGIANTFWTRLAGLQFQLPIKTGHGILLHPARGIHTFWMRGPIDVVWADSEGRVVQQRAAIKPWRVQSAPAGSCVVLEMGVGTLNGHHELLNKTLSLQFDSGK